MPTTFANTIDGNDIYAKRAEQDKDGNQIDTTYAKTTDIPTDVVPAVTSSDDGKVLKASYSGGQGSYSWQTESGGGGSVNDVEVNGSSVVNAQGVAEITVPTQEQSNWAESDTTDPSYIQNKPTEKNLVAGSGISIATSSSSVTISADETVLFDSDANNTTATLSESYKNFEYCKFFFKNGDGDVICREVYSAAQSSVITVISGTISTEPKFYSKISTYAITSNTQIDHRDSISYVIAGNAITSYSSATVTNYIIRVVGVNRISS